MWEAFGNQSEQIWGGLELINAMPLGRPDRHVKAKDLRTNIAKLSIFLS